MRIDGYEIERALHLMIQKSEKIKKSAQKYVSIGDNAAGEKMEEMALGIDWAASALKRAMNRRPVSVNQILNGGVKDGKKVSR